MTMIKHAAIYYSASIIYDLFHLESAMALCLEARLQKRGVTQAHRARRKGLMTHLHTAGEGF